MSKKKLFVYRYDSQQAQTENHTIVAKLKREKEELLEEIKTLKFELDRSGREMDSVRLRLESVEQQTADSSSHHEGVLLQKVAALEEEITLLRQHTLNSNSQLATSDLIL